MNYRNLYKLQNLRPPNSFHVVMLVCCKKSIEDCVMYVKESLDKVVYKNFITGFYSCIYHPGEVLDPAELAEKYGVSRTPVVQALKRLANEKIIGVRGNGRFFIPIPTEATLRGVCRTRILFEQEAIVQLVTNHNEESIHNLHEMAECCFLGIETENSLESVKRDMDFHRMLVASAGNSCLQELYGVVLNRYISIKYVLRDQYINQKAAANRHLEMMHYIDVGDAESAKMCSEKHIQSSMDFMIGIINSTLEDSRNGT